MCFTHGSSLPPDSLSLSLRLDKWIPAINSVLLLTHSAPSDSASSSAPLIHLSLSPCLRHGVCANFPLQVDPDGGRNPRLRCKQVHQLDQTRWHIAHSAADTAATQVETRVHTVKFSSRPPAFWSAGAQLSYPSLVLSLPLSLSLSFSLSLAISLSRSLSLVSVSVYPSINQ